MLNPRWGSLLRSGFLGCHATLPLKEERCVTSQKTAAKETTGGRETPYEKAKDTRLLT